MPWYFYLLDFLGGAFLMNGVPHLVQGVSGTPFQSPFAKPPGEGESSPVVNVVWGFANLTGGFLLLHYFFFPEWLITWVPVGAGVLMMGLLLSWHFGKVRAGKHRTR